MTPKSIILRALAAGPRTRPQLLEGHDGIKTKLIHALKALRDSGEVEKRDGESPKKSLYALTGAPRVDVPPPSRAGKPKKGAAPLPRSAEAERFIAAITADRRLVLINGAGHELFDQDKTNAIADLVLANFETE